MENSEDSNVLEDLDEDSGSPKSNVCKDILLKAQEEELKANLLLKQPDLLLHIIEDIQKTKNVEGEEDTILAIMNKVSLRLVKNHSPTSSNMVIDGRTGIGKDWGAKAVCYYLVPEEKLFHRIHISEKALIYWSTNKDKDFTWDGCVVYLEDPTDDILKSDTFRTMASGGGKATTVSDKRKAMDIGVEGKPVIMVTSYNATIDEEGMRRWDSIRMDSSEELTKRVINSKLKKAENPDQKPKFSYLSKVLQDLKAYNVVIPYATVLEKHLPKTLIMRTQVDKILDYIKASAIIHQKQRDVDEKGNLIANDFDYDYGRYVFLKLNDARGGAISKKEEEIINILLKAKTPLSVSEISEDFSHSKQWIYNHQGDMKAKGLIEEILEWNEMANKPVTKFYTKYKPQTIDIPTSNVLVLTGFNRFSNSAQREGFNGFNGFPEIKKRINEKREKNGFYLISC